jgi:uncharacterized metal-binding protein YceD (DUF177 family)
MSVLINLRLLEKDEVHVAGEVSGGELDIEGVDELVQMEKPLRYDLEAQKLEDGILVTGDLGVDLKCECARCLKAFVYRLELKDWACHLPLEGEEKVVISNDCVDLTPHIREDILLGFPQHPLCKPECGGLPKKAIGKAKKTNDTGRAKETGSAWTELNKLKF